ncbi:hypothetical protein, partial [Nocardia cyriacigeorgica]|uniref:hypothetical protein n=1 Tax=Nocardia cyriacigeorgica TaxID=135487 RepID=UPI00245564E1
MKVTGPDSVHRGPIRAADVAGYAVGGGGGGGAGGAAARVPVKAGPHAFPTVTEPLVDLLIPERRSLDDPALTLARN